MVRVTTARALALIASFLPAAFAIHEVGIADCQLDLSENYFVVNYQQITGGRVFARCFADAGDISIIQDFTVSYIAGNNAGYFEYEPGDGSRYRHDFVAGSTIETNGGNGYGDFSSLHIN